MEISEAREVKQLRDENARLKKLVGGSEGHMKVSKAAGAGFPPSASLGGDDLSLAEAFKKTRGVVSSFIAVVEYPCEDELKLVQIQNKAEPL